MEHNHIPYPKIKVEEQNPEYAKEILSNISGENSKMSSVCMYFYNHLVTESNPELSGKFRQIGLTEMRHLELFSNIAFQLGADPRLWELRGKRKVYWSSKSIKYSMKPKKMLMEALFSEHLAVDKYTKQTKLIKDVGIIEALNRIIIDDKEHIKMLTDLLHGL